MDICIKTILRFVFKIQGLILFCLSKSSSKDMCKLYKIMPKNTLDTCLSSKNMSTSKNKLTNR